MAAAVAPVVLENLRLFEDNLRWAKENPAVLRKYQGKYVVVQDKAVTFSSTNPAAARAKASDHPGAYFTFVPPRGLAWIL